MGLPDLGNVKVIGEGAFGEVHIAQNVDASRTYVMKSPKKDQVRSSYPLFVMQCADLNFYSPFAHY